MSRGEKEIFVVIHCEKDDSHVRVPESDVICALETATVGEQVHFSYPGEKKLLRGTVKKVGTNPVELDKFLHKINSETKPPREPSFDERRPRRAALKHTAVNMKGYKNNNVNRNRRNDEISSVHSSPNTRPQKRSAATGAESAGASTKKTKEEVHETAMNTKKASEGSESSLQKLLNTVSSSSGSDSSDSDESIHLKKSQNQASDNHTEGNGSTNKSQGDCDSDSDDSSFTQEDAELLAILSKKKRMKEMKDLSKLSKAKISATPITPNNNDLSGHPNLNSEELKCHEGTGDDMFESHGLDDFVQEQGQEEKIEKEVNPLEGKEKAGNIENVEDKETRGKEKKSSDNDSSDDEEQSKGPKRVYQKKQRCEREIVEHKFQGNFYRYTGDEKKPALQKLLPDGNIWISDLDLKLVKKRWHTGTAVARAVARGIFSDEALLNCSVSGKVKVNKDGKGEKRTALDPSGVEAVLEYTKHRCRRKTWPEPTESALKQAINNMMYEERGCKVVVQNK